MNLCGISMSAGYAPSSYVAGVFLIYVFLLVGFGYFVGSFLAKKVRAKLMMAGSVVYWMVALVNWLYLYFNEQEPNALATDHLEDKNSNQN